VSELAQATQAPADPAAPAPAASPAAPAEGEETPAQNTAEQAPATAPEGGKPEKTGQDPEKQSSRRFERRLDKAYRKAAEAQARADFFEKQLNELKQPKAADVPGAPKLEQFDDIEKYAEARAKHEREQALKEYQAKQQTESHKQLQARIVESWSEKAESASDKYEDFEEVVGDIKPTSPWAMAVMKSANGADVAYHLGKNEKEARRIMSLEPVDQILEIGLLAAKLAAEPPKPKTPSRAPAPITPLTGATPAASDTPSDQDDIGAWIKKRQKQVHGSRVR